MLVLSYVGNHEGKLHVMEEMLAFVNGNGDDSICGAKSGGEDAESTLSWHVKVRSVLVLNRFIHGKSSVSTLCQNAIDQINDLSGVKVPCQTLTMALGSSSGWILIFSAKL